MGVDNCTVQFNASRPNAGLKVRRTGWKTKLQAWVAPAAALKGLQRFGWLSRTDMEAVEGLHQREGRKLSKSACVAECSAYAGHVWNPRQLLPHLQFVHIRPQPTDMAQGREERVVPLGNISMCLYMFCKVENRFEPALMP